MHCLLPSRLIYLQGEYQEAYDLLDSFADRSTKHFQRHAVCGSLRHAQVAEVSVSISMPAQATMCGSMCYVTNLCIHLPVFFLTALAAYRSSCLHAWDFVWSAVAIQVQKATNNMEALPSICTHMSLMHKTKIA